MIASSVFIDSHMVVAMQKLHRAMNGICYCMGDVSLGEYSLAVNIAEFDDGFPLAWAKSEYECFGNPLYRVDFLEEKELVTRMRNRADRRGFALKVTPKGRARIGLIDGAMATKLVSANKHWLEAEFEYLVAKMHALPNSYDVQRRIATIFPGSFLSLVHRYHQIVVKVAAFYGLTSLQATILYALEKPGSIFSPHQIESMTGMPEAVSDFQIDDLVKKDLIHNGQSLELTEKGIQRIEGFSRKASHQLDALFADHREEDTSPFEELGEYCIYLFR